MDLRDITSNTGLKKNMIELKEIDTSEKLKEIKENKSSVRSIDKIRLDIGIAIIINYYKKKREVLYFESGSTGRLYYNKLRRIINIKV